MPVVGRTKNKSNMAVRVCHVSLVTGSSHFGLFVTSDVTGGLYV